MARHLVPEDVQGHNSFPVGNGKLDGELLFEVTRALKPRNKCQNQEDMLLEFTNECNHFKFNKNVTDLI